MYRTFVELRPENTMSTRGAVAAPSPAEVRILFQDHVAVHPFQRLKLETDPLEIEMRRPLHRASARPPDRAQVALVVQFGTAGSFHFPTARIEVLPVRAVKYVAFLRLGAGRF